MQHSDAAYPPVARAANAEGNVVLRVEIAADGSIAKAEPISGPPVLLEPATDTVKQWRYIPFERNGSPVVAHTTVVVPFTLRTTNSTRPIPPILERSPEKISALPADIQRDLVSRNCSIPSYPGSEIAYLFGNLRSANSTDYAIICHIPTHNLQHLLVYSFLNGAWIGERIASSPFEPEGCQPTITTASPDTIRDYARAFARDELKDLHHLDHDGIDVDFCDKASTVYYFKSGQWLQYQGAD
jgi:TonB family protein